MAYYAHSGLSQRLEDDGEPLADHLRKVSAKAGELAHAATPDSSFVAAARAAGLLHDLGKYQPEWQAYLRADVAKKGSGRSVPHAVHGAAAAIRWLDALPLAAAIQGHHSGLHDYHRVYQLEDERASKLPNARLDELRAVARGEIAELPEGVGATPDCVPDDAIPSRRGELWTRFLFSVLIDADRLETESFTRGTGRTTPPLAPAALLVRLEAERAERAGDKTDRLTGLRNEVFTACVTAGEWDRGFFDLTVPTGGGKTLSGMAFALAHAERHELRRGTRSHPRG